MIMTKTLFVDTSVIDYPNARLHETSLLKYIAVEVDDNVTPEDLLKRLRVRLETVS